MTLKPRQKRTTTIMAIATIALLVAATISQIPNAFAVTCSPGVQHCYAIEGKPGTTTYGNKFTVSVPNIDNTSSHSQAFGTVETWVRFPDNDWIETGVIQGYLDGSGTKTDEYMFAANDLMGVWQSTFLDDVTTGTTYTFEYEDDDANWTWDAKLNGVSKWQRIITWSRGTGTDAGAEISYDLVIIPKTRLYDISLHNGSVYSYWSSANFFDTIPSPTTEMYIKNHSSTPYRSICVATGSISTCP